MLRTIAACTLILFVACDKPRTVPQPPRPTPEPEKETTTIAAPKGVPQSLKDMVERDWPKIEEEGNAFLAEFKAADKARAAGDRDKMDVAVEAARKHFNAALEKWNAIYYSIDDIEDEQRAEKCRRWLRKWNKHVDGWTRKAKGLKEFSRVK